MVQLQLNVNVKSRNIYRVRCGEREAELEESSGYKTPSKINIHLDIILER